MLKWYEKKGKDSDVVLSSRIRLARNTTEYPFSTKISADEGKNLVDRVFEMEVPCCGGLEYAARTALQNSGKFIPWQVVTISTDGKILD